MKTLFFIFAATAIMLTSCIIDDYSNDPGHKYQSEGLITGQDFRKCMCCSGWFITIDNSHYRFLTIPEGSSLNLDNAKFPVKVLLDWKKVEDPCMGDEIIVTRIQRK